jgi:hypothetical protein
VRALPSLSGAHSRTASHHTGTRKQDPRVHRQRLRVGEGDGSWRVSYSATLPQSPQSLQGLALPSNPSGEDNRELAGNTAHQHSGRSPQVILLAPPSPRRCLGPRPPKVLSTSEPLFEFMSNRLMPPGSRTCRESGRISSIHACPGARDRQAYCQ